MTARAKNGVWSRIVGSLAIVLVFLSSGVATAEIRLVKGQTVYVPAYSHIYHGDREQTLPLTITLSIRNTDSEKSISIVSVDYFDTEGKLIKSYLEKEMVLGPMGSTRFVVKESDRSGGSGANFIVRWKSATKVTEPIIESIMITTVTQQGISFSSRGQAIKEDPDR